MRAGWFFALFLGSGAVSAADLGMMPDLKKFGEWLADLLLYIPRKLFEGILVALADVLNWALSLVPFVSDAASSVGSFLATMNSLGVGWWLSWFHLGYGISVVLAASGTRFLIRRLPYVG